MSDFARCTSCGNYGYVGEHQCPPAWRCWIPEEGDEEDGSDIHGSDAEEAAAKFCERRDARAVERCWYERVVSVRRLGDDAIATVAVEAEATVVYHGRELP